MSVIAAICILCIIGMTIISFYTPKVKVQILSNLAKVPEYKTADAACFDIFSIKDANILGNGTAIIDTGLAMEIPTGYKVSILPRSGLATQGLEVIQGTIDSDYRGEIKVIIKNNTDSVQRIYIGERIAQGELVPTHHTIFREVGSLTKTSRGSSGFGSTGAFA